MVWFFERHAELLRIETTHEQGVFVLKIYREHGEVQTETFRSEVACHKRLERLERQLRADCWALRLVAPLRSP
jgi:hypothetical protein